MTQGNVSRGLLEQNRSYQVPFIYRDMLYLQTTAILQTNDLSSLSLVYLTLIFLVDENRSPLIRRYQYHTLLREVRP